MLPRLDHRRTMLTVDSINQLFADHAGGGGFIQPLTTPVAGDFTALNFNTGTGVATTQSNNTSSISLLQHDPNTTQQMAALAKSKLASTFTIQLGMSMMGFPIGNNTPNQCIAGIWISDGGSPPNNIFWCLQGDNQGYRIPVFSDFSTFAGDILPQGSSISSRCRKVRCCGSRFRKLRRRASIAYRAMARCFPRLQRVQYRSLHHARLWVGLSKPLATGQRADYLVLVR